MNYKKTKKLLIIGLFIISGCGQTQELSSKGNSLTSDDSTNNTSSINSSSFNHTSVEKKDKYSIQVININDLHGAIEDSENGNNLAYMSAYIKELENHDDDVITIKIANGDMFQGTALSNYSKGRLVVDILNELEFDAFTIGNHEFDWGVDILENYQDGDLSNGEANFPFLGANIYEKATAGLADFAKEYTIVEEQGLKIGIIGTIGYGLENSISASRVADYQFKQPQNIVKQIAKHLRTNENVDIIIVANHNGGKTSGNITENTSMAAFDGDEQIDVILNGHSHQVYTTTLLNKGRVIPVVQSGANGSHLGIINFDYNQVNNNVIDIVMENNSIFNVIPDQNVSLLIENEKIITDPYFKQNIGLLGENTTRATLAEWEANVMKKAFETDISMVNTNGIRSYDYYQYETITLEMVIKMMPFDNMVKLVDLTGQQINNICNKYSGLSTNSGFSCDNRTLEGVPINYSQIYRVAAIDYIFDKENLDFLSGDNIVMTGYTAQELMILDIIECMKYNSYWYPSSSQVHLPKQPII